jgi:uncharacterized YigZ family protein
MNTTEFYYTIEQTSEAEYRDRGSKFIAYAFHIDNTNDFKKQLEETKKKHPKATHHCFAYRIGIDKNIFRVSDDGEPSGTAGKPILGQIDSKELTDTLIVVVRYFGGTLLGVPGLIHAYKMAASLVLQLTPAVKKDIMAQYKLHFDYTRMNDVMRLVKSTNAIIISQESQLFCDMTIGISMRTEEIVVLQLKELQGVEYKKII